MGGLSKKSQQIKLIKKSRQQPAIILDAGNLLFKQATVSESQELITASGIMDIYKNLSYDAVAIGPHDLAAGLEFLQKAQRNGFPWLSANIIDSDKKTLFKPSVVVKRAGLAIGIIGLTDPTAPVPRGITVTDWQKALSDQLTALEKNCDLLVVLSTLAGQDNAELTRIFPQVHILLTASNGLGNILPRIVNSTLISQTHSQGKYLGILDLNWHLGQPWGKDFSQESLSLHDRLNVLNRQILRAESQNAQPGSAAATLQNFKQERQALLEKIETVKQQATLAENEKQPSSSFQSSFIALKKNLPDDPEIAQRVSQIKERIRTYNQDSLTALPLKDQTKQTGDHKKPEGYTGFMRCSQCHAPQAEFWKTTGHARAYQTLEQQRQNFNLDCLPCHVTGADQTSQKAPVKKQNLVDLQPEMRSVGCESCHGPGSAHAADPEKNRPKRQVAESTCLACHTRDRSPGFTYPEKISKVSCPGN